MGTTIPHAALLEGVLNVKKDYGWTSHDVVAKVRGALGGIRVGHAGTLDPAATGVLPLLLGRATRIAEHLVDWDKEYRAILRLGESTNTQDATGRVLTRVPTEHLTEAAIRTAIAQFEGSILQVPPMFSAVKVAGVPLYKSARAGRSVAREPRRVRIHRLEVEEISGPEITLRVVCSKGTYIRTLCADIGAALGVGGHLRALVRLRVGPLTFDDALSVEAVCQLALRGEAMERLGARLLSLDQALADVPALVLTEDAAYRVRHGVPVPLEAILWDQSTSCGGSQTGQTVRLKDQRGRLLALGTLPGQGASVKINKVLSD